jgi:hypothetical protein
VPQGAEGVQAPAGRRGGRSGAVGGRGGGDGRGTGGHNLTVPGPPDGSRRLPGRPLPESRPCRPPERALSSPPRPSPAMPCRRPPRSNTGKARRKQASGQRSCNRSEPRERGSQGGRLPCDREGRSPLLALWSLPGLSRRKNRSPCRRPIQPRRARRRPRRLPRTPSSCRPDPFRLIPMRPRPGRIPLRPRLPIRRQGPMDRIRPRLPIRRRGTMDRIRPRLARTPRRGRRPVFRP